MPLTQYDNTKAPVRPNEVVTWAVSQVKGISDLMAQLGGSYVYAHREPDNAPARYVVVMQEQPAGGTVRTLTGVRRIRFLVRIETEEDMPNPDTFHAQAHEAIRSALVGQSPGVTSGSVETPVGQFREPDVPRWDADDESYYSATGYSLAIQPA